MKNRLAFTMLELIFVIVIMGIIGKFGVEFLGQTYNSFIYSKINESLQAKSEMAVESIAKRLQFRIKDSIIRRKSSDYSFAALATDTNYGDDYNILEWIGVDIDGFRGVSTPLWSGIIDLDVSSKTTLKSPETNTTALNNLIQTLSHNSGTTLDDSALYFIGSDSDINSYGWAGDASINQNDVMHPIKAGDTLDKFNSSITGVDFSGIDIYEYYQLAWSAYAFEHNPTTKELFLYYDYQPWRGEMFTGGKKSLLMQNVSTFRFKAVGSVVKIQVCVKSDLLEDYSLCKEKTIY